MSNRAAWKRTKIVCTLGPATDAPGVLEALARSGMNVARVNLSHGEHAEHARRITQVREIARR
ncbi:MAG: pyruvate kinase, partial [Reyranella sp.]|nr:pyruvate kinase [Reyranella sp.]